MKSSVPHDESHLRHSKNEQTMVNLDFIALEILIRSTHKGKAKFRFSKKNLTLSQ